MSQSTIMEQTTKQSSIESPKIQLDQPCGIDRRAFLPSSPPDSTLLTHSLGSPSVASESLIDDDPSEDWTRTTAEKDSWAHRERRRSSMWQKIDCYPSSKPAQSSNSGPRHGSILSLFTHGKDKDGRDVLHSGNGDPEERSAENDAHLEPHVPSEAPDRTRRGSILSMWTPGKDKEGRDVIHSGYNDSA